MSDEEKNLVAASEENKGAVDVYYQPIEDVPIPPQSSLIGEPNVPTLDPNDAKPIAESNGGCGLPEDMRWLPIVVAVIFVLLIVCIVLFILHLRAEAKRRRAAARRRARKRAQEAQTPIERR